MSDNIPRSPAVQAELDSEDLAASLTRVIEDLDLGDPIRSLGRDLQARRAVESLRTYITNIGATRNARQVVRLLWVIAGVERALWLETDGRLGVEHAHMSSVLDRYLAGSPPAAGA